jgi:hypothetical protein
MVRVSNRTEQLGGGLAVWSHGRCRAPCCAARRCYGIGSGSERNTGLRAVAGWGLSHADRWYGADASNGRGLTSNTVPGRCGGTRAAGCIVPTSAARRCRGVDARPLLSTNVRVRGLCTHSQKPHRCLLASQQSERDLSGTLTVKRTSTEGCERWLCTRCQQPARAASHDCAHTISNSARGAQSEARQLLLCKEAHSNIHCEALESHTAVPYRRPVSCSMWATMAQHDVPGATAHHDCTPLAATQPKAHSQRPGTPSPGSSSIPRSCHPIPQAHVMLDERHNTLCQLQQHAMSVRAP